MWNFIIRLSLKNQLVFEIPVKLAKFPNLPNISAKLKNIVEGKWSPIHGLAYLTSVI